MNPVAQSAPVAGFVDLGGARLFYETRGRGQAVVFIHAGIADRRMWDPQVAVFARHFQVVRYDSFGFGRSDTALGPNEDCRELSALLHHLGIERASLVGASRGARIALEFALRFPARVRRLVLVAPGIPGAPVPDEVALRGREAWLAARRRGDIGWLIEFDLGYWLDGPAGPAGRVREPLRSLVRDMALAVHKRPPEEAELRRAMSDPFVRDHLGEVEADTLVLVGSLDAHEIHAAAELIAARLPTSVVKVPRAAHLLNMERPRLFNRLAIDFLAQA